MDNFDSVDYPKEEIVKRYSQALNDVSEIAVLYDNDLQVECNEKNRQQKKANRANFDWQKEKEKSKNLEKQLTEKDKILAEKDKFLAEKDKFLELNNKKLDELDEEMKKLIDMNRELIEKNAEFEVLVEEFRRKSSKNDENLDKNGNFEENSSKIEKIDENPALKCIEKRFNEFSLIQSKFYDDLKNDLTKNSQKNGDSKILQTKVEKLKTKNGNLKVQNENLQTENEELKKRLETREKDYVQEIEVLWQTYNAMLMKGQNMF